MFYFDSHCHLQFQAYNEDRGAVLARCLERGMRLLFVGTQKDTSRAAVELAHAAPGHVFAAVGLHPVHLHPRYVDEKEGAFMSREESFDAERYRALCKDPAVVALGETGLDLYRIPDDVPRDEVITAQKAVFIQHINLARETNKALVIHCRDAYGELADIVRDEIVQRGPLRATVHCFTGTSEEARALTDLGLYIGFTGIITFAPRAAENARQEELYSAAASVPDSQLLIETDAPYLAPAAYRGQRNEPWMVEEVAKKIAELRGVDERTIRDVTAANAARLFGIE